MDPATMAMIAGAGANVLGGIFGAQEQAKAREEQMKLLRQFYKEVDAFS
ncbi:MAG: hypothetical protein RLZZ181_128 [Pseudomonadota bacterium]